MPAEFSEAGIRLKYPENWEFSREATEEGWTITIQSPATAFVMMTLREDSPGSEEMVETALAALRELYPDLEADTCVDNVAGQPAIGHDVRFFSLDLTNTCWTRSIEVVQGTILLMCQFNDLESEIHQAVLRAICASLEVEE